MIALREAIFGVGLLLAEAGNNVSAQTLETTPPPGHGIDAAAINGAPPLPATAPNDPNAPPGAVPADASPPLDVPPGPDAAPGPDTIPFELAPTPEEMNGTTQELRHKLDDLPDLPDVPDLLVQDDPALTLSIISEVHLGSFTLAFGAGYEALYDTNILLASSGDEQDFEHILSPRISIGLGDYVKQKLNFLALAYDPQILFFQHYNQFNTVNQQFRLNGQSVSPRATLQGNLGYDQSSDPDRELQGRVSRIVISAEGNATYQATDRFSYEANASALVRNYQDEINSDEARLRAGVRYTVSPDCSIALQGVGGVLAPEAGATQLIQQGWLAADGNIGLGFSYDIKGGADVREPQSTGQVLATPVFDATLRYEPSTETKFELSGVREIFSSPDVVDEDYISTRLSAKVSQRLWLTYKVAIEGGFENASYEGFGLAQGDIRVDNYPYARVEFSYARFEDLELSVFYEVGRNFSTESELSFSDQQVGIQFRVGY